MKRFNECGYFKLPVHNTETGLVLRVLYTTRNLEGEGPSIPWEYGLKGEFNLWSPEGVILFKTFSVSHASNERKLGSYTLEEYRKSLPV